MILYNPSWDEFNPWPDLFIDTILTTPRQLSKGGALILWGGEDIWPGFYGQKPNMYCYSQYISKRDMIEKQYVEVAIDLGLPIIGICRGAQLVCALAGGSLAQHIENHGRSHAITLHDEGDAQIKCNSSHHQMMIPPTGAVVLASAEATNGIDENNEPIQYDRVNEVVWFPSINALGIQPHPEWENSPKEFNDYIERKIKEYLL